MNLEEILNVLNENIEANGGTLKLAAQTIPSPEITAIFSSYLLDGELIVEKAVAVLNIDDVTVRGMGNSLIFFQTEINALRFTVSDGVPALSVDAEAIIKAEDGWTFGRSFPVLKGGYWDGFFNPANPTEWIQYIFFDNAKFLLSTTGLTFSGSLKLVNSLDALSALFNTEQVELSGKITLNQGTDGYKVTNATVVPEMKLIGKIGTIDLSLGSFPVFALDFSMNSSAYVVTQEGVDKGRPLPVIEILIESTMPIDGETIGVAIPVGIQSESLTMRAIMPTTKDIGISELIALANNENLLALMPSNIPVIYDFVLKDWQLTFNTSQKTCTQVAIQVGTRETFSWAIIPGYITLKSADLWFGMTYLGGTFSPSLAIEGVITLGSGDSAVNFIISASFPSYVFMGSLDPDTPVDLRGILVYLLGETIGNSLPDTLQLGVLNMTVDPKNSTYSLETALTTDLEIPVVLTTIVVRTVLFDIKYVAGVATGSITGEFQVGTAADAPFLFVTAAYNGPQEGWMFSGGLKDGSKINLKDIIDTYLPAEYHDFNPLDISITTLFLSFNQGATPEDNTYNFKFGAEWTLDLGLSDPLIITGLIEIAYTKVTVGSPYTGFIEGALNLGNINIRARVDFKNAYNDYTFTFLNRFVAKLTHNVEGDSIICFQFTDETSLGSLIELLVNAATGQDITLPSPWNVMNNIKLKDFGFSFNVTKNKIGLSYRPSINLGFIDIKEITLYYTYYPNDPQKQPLVEIAITDGSFLGGAMPLPQPWNVLEPDQAPAVPGQGGNLFRLDFMGLGQHVSLKDGLNPNSVSQAVDLLKAAFERDGNPTVNPIAGTGLQFNSSSNWLIGTQFVVVDTFAIGIVFFDPNLYGLSLYVNGPKAKVFQGLKFEILYKKVSDTVGVYQVYLKLPDAIRQIDFGAVSVTLPSVKIYIYTNGDFKIDFGFPVNDDFSESFGLQMLPFIGSGGFYFGLLSAETAETVPVATNGNFSPVIVFGVGLRVGIGKEINKGILKAGISIVVQGILEGTYAQFNFYNGQSDDISYYYILGKIAIVGHVYGAVNFVIISAEVDLKVFVSARLVFESYEPILISLSAGVSVSLKVRINLGIFSISINLSFSTTITESFTVGSKQSKPWITESAYAAYFRPVSLRALDEETSCPVIPEMNWLPIVPNEKIDLEIVYIPQFTAATDGDAEQRACVVAMLYLESSIDQPSSEDVDYPFDKFAKGVFLWALGAYFNKTNEGIPVDTLMEQEISAGMLQEIICYFSQSDLIAPFSIDQVFTFLANYLNATVVVPPRTTEPAAEKSVSVLPILPNLIFETPVGDVYFNNDQAQYTYDPEQLQLIRAYFDELSVPNQGTGDSQKPSPKRDTADKQSLATFMLIDYISLLAKESAQKGIDRLTSLVITVGNGDSVDDIVNRYPHFGISAMELAYSNRLRSLSGGIRLAIKNSYYTVKHQDTLASISQKFNVHPDAIVKANTFLTEQNTNPCSAQPFLQHVEVFQGFGEDQAPIPGSRIRIPGIVHTTSNERSENLLSVANRYQVAVLDLIAENTAVKGLFPTDSKIAVPFAEKLTVADLIAAMEANNDFEQLSGLSANMMLQGLRVPLPAEDSTIGEPKAMYQVSGQEIEANAFAGGETLKLKLDAALDWLNLGTPGGTELSFELLAEDITALHALQQASLKPVILELKAAHLCEVQARKFTLPSNITWQLPEVKTWAKSGDNLLDEIDPSIWMFQNDLNVLLNGYDAVAPKVQLLKQVQETTTTTAPPEPITNYSWSTKIDVRIQQVKSAENPALLMPNVYELQGIDQASMTLLQNLITYYALNPETAIIDEINILYPKEPAKEGQTAPPNGLRSDGMENTSIYLLQTNLSTLSNPPQLGASMRTAKASGTQENLLGMSQLDFLKYMWEAAIVGSGGYYLYYAVKDSKAGLPDYLFNGDADPTITVVITYDIQDHVLRNFLNSAVVKDPVSIQDEILYVETLPQSITGGVTDDDTLGSLAKKYDTTVSAIALQNQTARLKQGVGLRIPRTAQGVMNGEHISAASESLALIAQAYGVSLIALAHANKNTAGLFEEGSLTFDSRIEVKVATVPPGNIGFTMERQRPSGILDLSDAELNLQELYSLLGYNIAANTDFNASVPGLPIAPGDNQYTPPSDIETQIRPTAIADDQLRYNRIVPVYPFAKSSATAETGDDVPAEDKNPYRAVGKTAQIDLRWQDIFGNLTSFTNTGGPGIPTSLPPVEIGYIDPVIGISLYPSVSASYIIDNDNEGVPNLYVTLAFNPTNYLPVDETGEAWKKRATSDKETYKQIYYQLIQPDVTVSISSSLEDNSNTQTVTDTAKETLLNLVLAIYQYLGELISGATPSLPVDEVITYPINDTNPLSLFALVTQFTISRDINLVDDNFKDEPSVIFSTSVLGPSLHSITIQDFAQKLQDAFPALKVASGTPQTGVVGDSSIELWVARFDDTDTGIRFTIPNSGSPFYFALLPLANHLLSRDDVKIYPYYSGVPISQSTPVNSSFTGVDIEKLAETCLSAIDVFLQADFAIPAWQVENTIVVDGDKGDDEILRPYQYIVNAKKTLADNIVKHLATVLDDDNVPDTNNIENAQERLKQELLISLSSAYSIDTVLQFNVDVKSPYQNPASIAPQLFGKVIDPDTTASTDQQAYAFSTTRFSLESSDTTDQQLSYLTILFNSKKENNLHLESGYFPINLHYEINSIEHNIQPVSGIEGYKSSSWLTFILPFKDNNTALGDLKIPIPLRAYPTSPSLTSQTFNSFGQADKLRGLNDEDKLQQAKEWDYRFTYDYLRAQQDTINTDIIVNVSAENFNSKLFADDEDPDLLAALLQFSSAYPAIQQDLNRYLLDQSNPEYAYTAMQSFAWLVKRVASAWGTWQEHKKMYRDGVDGETDNRYQLVETQKEIDGQTALLIVVTSLGSPDFLLPAVDIDGFVTEVIEDKPEMKSFAYYMLNNNEKSYLPPEAGEKINQRNVTYRKFNIINQENVWSGISVIRNKILVPGIKTNEEFIYTTPTIRFVSVLTPLLDPDVVINIADYTTGDEKQPLQLYLSNFLKALFVELIDETTARQLKIGTVYSYNIQAGIDGLNTEIPISISTPFYFTIPTDWDVSACPISPDEITPTSPFVCQLAALIQKWFSDHNPDTTNAKFRFDISLFSGLSNTQLPILRLRNLYLNENDINWS